MGEFREIESEMEGKKVIRENVECKVNALEYPQSKPLKDKQKIKINTIFNSLMIQ